MVAEDHAIAAAASFALEHKAGIQGAEDGLVGIGGSQDTAIGRQGDDAPLQRNDLFDLNTAVGLVADHDADLALLAGCRNQAGWMGGRNAAHIDCDRDGLQATGGPSDRAAELGTPNHPTGRHKNRQGGRPIHQAETPLRPRAGGGSGSNGHG